MGQDLSVRVLQRDFTDPLAAPDVDYRVRGYAWNVIGGPDWAEIEVSGLVPALWEMIEMLRCPVEILNPRGERRWWGLLSSVDLGIGNVQVGVSLETMANRIAVAYSLVEPGSSTVGARATTSWAQNDDSVATYGTKELLASISGATTASAEQLRATLLAQKRYPIPNVSFNPGGGDLKANLRCLGWWSTLDWKTYLQTGKVSTETTAQIAAIVTAAGQFLTSTQIDTASGISSSQYRDGDTTALAEIEDLLRTGTTNSRRLLATVTAERLLRVTEEPVSGPNDYMILSDGSLHDGFDVPLLPDACTVGVWARMKDVIPATVDVSKLANPSPVFIEAAEYDAEKMIWKPQPRGVPSVWEMSSQIGE